MLQPARRKYRKEQKGRNTGIATRGNSVAFGDFGLKSTDRGRLTARQIEAALPAGGTVMALHETGASMTSTDLAGWIGALRDSGTPHLTFLIGGADGLDPALLRRADRMLSFSALTWPHQLVRIMLAEQLYRVTTILSGHPYHRQ